MNKNNSFRSSNFQLFFVNLSHILNVFIIHLKITPMLSTLKKYFGYNSFRPMQEDIIRHILSNKDCLVLMPTGGGKSICYQIPALMMPGTAIVVSPLISLMKDQVESLRANGIAAAALNSNASEAENHDIAERANKGEYKLLYVSPEKLMSEIQYGIFSNSHGTAPTGSLKVSMFAIDEAHCISHWGHDFRPEYTQLGWLKELFPNVPVAAFTATADKITKEDIIQQLRLDKDETEEVKIFISSFDRPNLSLDVRRGYSAKDKLRFLLSLIARHHNESGIIYCMSRKTTEMVAEKLQEKGIRAKAYHAGLSAKERDDVQEAFIKDEIDVVCATVAFGMGIDKSNVRFVVHYNLPKSIESYYQEIGRGGRDGLPCETILFYQVGDLITLRKFAEDSGQQNINNEKLDRMQEYAESQVCRRRILLNYFGETMDHNCENCDVCKNPPQRFDGTILVQKALSAIMRTQQQVGFKLLIDILRGASNQEVYQKGYHLIKTYGCGRDVIFKDWQDYLLQMLHLGYIEIDYKDNSHIKITSQGEDVLYKRKQALLATINREDFTVKGRKQKELQQLHFEEQQTEKTEDKTLFENLRQLRLKIASERSVPPYVIFSDKTLHQLAIVQPITYIAFGSISGVGTHKLESLGTIFVKAIREYKGLSTNESEEWNNRNINKDIEIKDSVTTPKAKKSVRDFVTFNGTEYHIGSELMGCIKWRTTIEYVGKDVYYNLWKENRYPMTRYISEDVQCRDMVVKHFAEIISAVYNVEVSPDYQTVIIPVRTEYDENGKPVHSLDGVSFEEALDKYREFVEQNGHLPFATSGEYECSLRRWQQEINHDIRPLTHTQYKEFEELMASYADVPRTRVIWEKKKEQEKENMSYIEQQRLKHSKAYAQWTKEEDQKLIELYSKGETIEELCKIFARNKGAIKSRIKKLSQ